MTDLLLGANNDLVIYNGQLSLIQTQEELIRQRLLNRLRTFTGTLFTNINYGIDVNLIGSKTDKSFLDQDIKDIIESTPGIIDLVEFVSEVDLDRVYSLRFKYTIETGEIIGITNLGISSESLFVRSKGVWKDGYWDYSGIWDDEEIWGV